MLNLNLPISVSASHSRKAKTILITGASSGFGKLAVQLLLQRGHTVIAAIRGGQTRLASLFAQELQENGNRLTAIDFHLENPRAPLEALEWVEKSQGGKLDVLINNAGYGLFGAFEDLTPDQLRHQFEVNFFGPMFLTRALLPSLRATQGRVINVSSVVGLYTFPFYGSYSATKFAMEGMTESLYYELKSLGVQVALVEPGGFRTDFGVRSRVIATPSSTYQKRIQGLQRAFQKSTRRLGDPIRVSRLIADLCEKENIPLRNLVGYDAWALKVIARIFPESWRVLGTERCFRLLDRG